MSSEWLSKEISDLLASPHISFPKPPTGIHLGPGPIDLFSTKFNNLFALSVEAVVDGQQVSRDDLKQKLLNLQKHWDPKGVKFQDEPPTPPVRFGHPGRCSDLLRSAVKDISAVAILSSGETVGFLAEWVSFISMLVRWADLSIARTEHEGGKRVIKKFSVNGASSLFQ